LRVRPGEGRGDEFIVSGRGLLHLGILLENMRRERLGLGVGKPQVITKSEGGEPPAPIAELVVAVPSDAVGPVLQLALTRPRTAAGADGTDLEFAIPARGLIGLRTRLLNATNGRAIMHHNSRDYQPWKGDIPARVNGVMVSTETGKATGHAIENLQERGVMF